MNSRLPTIKFEDFKPGQYVISPDNIVVLEVINSEIDDCLMRCYWKDSRYFNHTFYSEIYPFEKDDIVRDNFEKDFHGPFGKELVDELIEIFETNLGRERYLN